MRLDQILSKKGKVEKAHLNEALEYQRQHGGRLETHLYRFGYASETTLIKALAEQYTCESITLGDIKIDSTILDMVPARLAREKLILPFEYDFDSNTLKIACESRHREKLANELGLNIIGKKIKLYVALGVTLKTAIIHFYRSHPVATEPGDIPMEISVPIDSPFFRADSSTITEVVQSHGKACTVLILNEHQADIVNMQGRLEDERFKVKITDSIDSFCKLAEKTFPDIQLLIKLGDVSELAEFIHRLITSGLSVSAVPTFLLTTGEAIEQSTLILKNGIEDVVPLSGDFDKLLIKMNRIRTRFEEESSRRISIVQDMGTHGSLEDMNVIDLIQMMGPSKKTAHISIIGRGRQLTIYLDEGRIAYAECDNKRGAEAVYQGIAWTRGIWSIEPIGKNDLPEPNNDLPNETILLEGCRLLDEQTRDSDNKSKSKDDDPHNNFSEISLF